LIFGLLAALGWGSADYGGAVAGRDIGSFPTVLISQGLSAAVVTLVFVAAGRSPSELGPVAWVIVFNGAVSATAYASHYKALRLGPMVVVSPVSAGYAVVGVVLSVIVLHERPSPLTVVGILVTVLGVMLASTDLAKLRAGTHGVPPGLPWALVAALCFGVGGFTLGWAAQQVGALTAMWGSRMAQAACFLALAALGSKEVRKIGWNAGTLAAAGTGLADMIGVFAFVWGATRAPLSIVLTASAIFPLIAVGLSVVFLHERPVTNQSVGACVAVVGLMLLGLGS
jgi:drug/metabolite transporter (DMT)-like permease